MLVVDPWHWLEADGSIPKDFRSFRTELLRVARLIEYGGPLKVHETRETLVECATAKRNGAACPGLLWVEKTEDDRVYAFCVTCATGDTMISNWRTTPWASGQKPPHDIALREDVRRASDQGKAH